MAERELVTLMLDKQDIGQILDGLRERLETWEYTVEYMQTGYVPEPYCIAECSSPEEAEVIAGYYKAIIDRIESQLNMHQFHQKSREGEGL